MKKTKKKLVTMLTLAMMLSLFAVGCGSDNQNDAANTTEEQTGATTAAENDESEAEDTKEEAEVVSENEETTGVIPAYEYPGPEQFYSVVYKYLVDEIGAMYSSGDVTIPCPIIVAMDESNKSDILLYGDFWVYNYELSGDTLMNISGGNNAGVMHIASTDEGYEVKSFDVVEDGAKYEESAKKIFGDHYDEFQKINSDQDAREATRAQIIANYVAANNLSITGYQDYGWDKQDLPKENIDSFYSDLK